MDFERQKEGVRVWDFETPGLSVLVDDGSGRGRPMRLVLAGEWKGWLTYLDVSGQWLSLRLATQEDRLAVYAAIWPPDTSFRLCRPLVENIPEGGEGWESLPCERCGQACWKRDIEPDELPPNVLATCTTCAIANR